MSLSLLLLSASAVAQLAAGSPVAQTSTTKSVAEFESCFVKRQASAVQPFWIVAYEDGVKISNEGTTGVADPWRVRFTQTAQGNRVQLLATSSASADRTRLAEAVDRCS